MKKLCFLSSLLLIAWVNIYAQDTINKSGYNIFYYPGGQKSSEGLMVDGKPDGMWISYYPTGVIKSIGKRTNHLLDSIWYFYDQKGDSVERISYILGKRNGYCYRYGTKSAKNADNREVVLSKELYVNDIREGKNYYYTNDGTLHEIVNYRQGKRDGISMEFGTDSLVIGYRVYLNDVLVENERVNRRDKKGLKQGVWRDYYTDGRVKKESYFRNDTLDGLYKEFNEKGALAVSLMYRNGKVRDLTASDTSTVQILNRFDSIGNLIYSGPYKNGVPVGIHRDYKNGKVIGGKLYDDNGVLIGEGIIDKEGNKEGPWTNYFPSGQVKSKGRYVENNRSGKWIFYFESGKRMQTGEYKQDAPDGEWIWYYPDGNVLRDEQYLNGKEDGHSVEYDPSGKVITEGDYIEGEKEGKWTYKVGDYAEQGNYITGLRDGLWKYYYENGNLMFQGNYVQGNADGKHLYYYDTGELKEECIYIMGLKEKSWKKYDKLGNVLITITYKDDQEIRVNGIKLDLPPPDKKVIR